MKNGGVVQRLLAEKAEISHHTLENWLTEKPWGREPSLLEKIGLSKLVWEMVDHARCPQRSPAKTADRWANVDWTRPNIEIAIALGVSEPAVYARRKILGHPKVKSRRVSKWSNVDWSKTDREIADERGVSVQAVNQYRHKFAP